MATGNWSFHSQQQRENDMRFTVFASMLLFPALVHCAQRAVLESALAIPLAAEVDLVVVGSGVGGMETDIKQ